MRTRDILKWHYSIRDMGELTLIVVSGLALGVLDQIACALERYMDRT